MEIKQSVCNYCSLGCNFDFYVKDNEIKKVVPTEGYPVNDGFACIKGLELDEQCTKYGSPNRPLIKDEAGNFQEISWNEAFDTFVTKMEAIQEEYGKKSAAFISTGQITTEEMALLGHIGRTHMGMNGDGNTRCCMATSVVAHKQSFGFDAPPYTLNDLELSDTIIFIGANPVVAHPIVWDRVKKNNDSTVISIDPRKSETASNSDMWIDIKPKTDLRLLYTLANLLIERDWIDQEYIAEYTEDFAGFKEHVKKYTLEDVTEKTGISRQQVLELAETIYQGERVSFWWTMGVNQGHQAVRTAQAIINLAAMTGNIGKPGTGPNSLTGQCNAMGSRVYSNTAGLYGGRSYSNLADRKKVANILDIDPEMIPKKGTIPYNEIVDGINKGEIKALWIIATNPRHSWANNEEFKRAIDNLDFFVVQDLYPDTETSELCDLFLPSVPAIKKEGTLINTERRVSAVTPVLDKEEDELSDYDIFYGIGQALDTTDSLDNWKTPKDAFELMKECSAGMPCDMTGIDYNQLVGSKGVQWPFRENEELERDQRRLYEDGEYFTETGKMKFIYEDIAEKPELQTEEFPYIFNSGRGTVGQWHTETRNREMELVEMSSLTEAYVYINPKLAQELDIKQNDKVLISSTNGQQREFTAKLSDTVQNDQLYAPIHYIETNALTPSVFDPYSKEPAYKYVCVNVEKIAE